MKKDGAFLILFRDDQRKEVFLVFRSDFPVWGLTGGGIEDREAPPETSIREAKEETGFEVKLLREIGIYKVVYKGRVLKTTYLYEGRVISGNFKPEFVGCKGEWFKIDHLPIDLTSRTKQIIVDAYQSQKKPFVKHLSREFSYVDITLFFRHPIATIKYFFKLT